MDQRRVLIGYLEGFERSQIIGNQPVSPGSRDPDRPGVEGWLSENGTLDLWIGASGGWTDSGVGLHIFNIGPSGFSGRWVAGAAITVVENDKSLGPPQGYFCAIRLP